MRKGKEKKGEQHALESESEKKRDSKKGIFLEGKDTHERKEREIGVYF